MLPLKGSLASGTIEFEKISEVHWIESQLDTVRCGLERHEAQRTDEYNSTEQRVVRFGTHLAIVIIIRQHLI